MEDAPAEGVYRVEAPDAEEDALVEARGIKNCARTILGTVYIKCGTIVGATSYRGDETAIPIHANNKNKKAHTPRSM